MGDGDLMARRPVAARRSGWAVATAATLARWGLRPNQVSVLSLVFAAAAGACLVLAGRAPIVWKIALLVAAAALIQLRLLCNLVDGMIAVEGGQQTKRGPVFNELPDRLSDAIILICAGYAVGTGWQSALGWCAALLAVLTAYVRALAGSLGATQDFGGPMAKQRRMEVISAASLLGAILAGRGLESWILTAALVLVAAGSVVTVARRSLHLVRELEAR